MLAMLPRDVRHLLLFAGGIAIFAQAIAATGVVRGPVEVLWSRLTSDSFFLTQGWINASFLLLYLGAIPPLREMVRALGLGLLVSLVHLGALVSTKGVAASSWAWVLIPVFWVSVAALVALFVRWRTAVVRVEKERAATLLAVAATLFLFTSYVSSYLNLTLVLTPKAYDLVALHLDGSLGFQPSVLIAKWVRDSGLADVFDFVYRSLAWASALFLGLYYRSGAPDRPRLFSFPYVWVLTMLALPAYFFSPVSGPAPAFIGSFPDNMKDILSLPAQVAITLPSFRNGVPSMHLGWALLLWLNARVYCSRIVAASFGIFAVLTAIATIGTGEHYLVDLVAAVPFVVLIQAMAMVGRPWTDRRRAGSLILGLGLWLFWVLAIRFGGGIFTVIPGLTWLALVVTLGSSAWAFRAMESAGAETCGGATTTTSSATDRGQTSPTVAAGRIYTLFFVSGFAGLIYEVLFSKALALTFGSTSTAAYTVLAVYMGGMALGAWLGGRLAQRTDRPLIAYASCELAIGLYCALTPIIFVATRGIYVSLAGDIPPDASILTFLRITLGALALLFPTVLMGVTLPLLVAHLERQHGALGNTIARLYGANTLGASLGALLCGYAILPALGIFRTTLLAALLNLLVALVALEYFKRIGSRGTLPGVASDIPAVAPHAMTRVSRPVAVVALVILGVGGAVTLGLEVHYIHLLAVVAGNSTYAFSLMLAAFLFGLGAGSEFGRRLLGSKLSHAAILVGLEAALAVAIWAGLFQWDDIPDHFAAYEHYEVLKTFGQREFVRAWICLLVMVPPSFLIGAIYPVAMDAAVRGADHRWLERVGTGAAINTLGNIAGVLGGGFLLLATVGAIEGLRIIGFVCLALSFAALLVTRRTTMKIGVVPLSVVAVVMALVVPTLDYTNLTTGANVYFRTQNWGEVIDRAESLDGGLTTVNRSQTASGPLLTLLTNGKFQGNNSATGEVIAQAGFAMAPLLHTTARGNALVIGYGTGMSARTLSDAGFANLDIVDLSGDIIVLADRYFSSVNGNVRQRRGVYTHVTDGRNFLLLQKRKYDLIGMEVSSIWFAGAASLYNREFYQLVKPRLNPGGVLQQWVQLHHMDSKDFLRIIGSVRSEFKNVWVYLIGGQGIIVASESDSSFPSDDALGRLDATNGLQWALASYKGSARTLSASLVLSPAGVDRMLGGLGVPVEYWVSTDDNLRLEYNTPRGNSIEGTFDANVSMMKRYSQP
jgi:predicted membrane-bound spermidine synthase